jgi:hypothetical protein
MLKSFLKDFGRVWLSSWRNVPTEFVDTAVVIATRGGRGSRLFAALNSALSSGLTGATMLSMIVTTSLAAISVGYDTVIDENSPLQVQASAFDSGVISNAEGNINAVFLSGAGQNLSLIELLNTFVEPPEEFSLPSFENPGFFNEPSTITPNHSFATYESVPPQAPAEQSVINNEPTVVLTFNSEQGESGETAAGNADAGEADTGEADAGETDAGETDTGESDVGETDKGEADTGESDTDETDTGEADAVESDGDEGDDNGNDKNDDGDFQTPTTPPNTTNFTPLGGTHYSATNLNTAGWASSAFTITALQGFELSLTSDATTWSATLVFDTETANGTAVFYVRNILTGEISVAANVNYKLDTTAPTGTVTVSNRPFATFINYATFGLFFRDSVAVSISGADNLSGVQSLQWFASAYDLPANHDWDGETWTDYTGTFNLPRPFVGFIYVRITDAAGNFTVIRSDGVVVYGDALAITTHIDHIKLSGAQAAEIALNGNTINSIYNIGIGMLTHGSHFNVNGGTVTFMAAYLDNLTAGNYTIVVSYHPLGMEIGADAQGDPINDMPNTTQITLTVILAAQENFEITNIPAEIIFGENNFTLSTTGGTGTGGFFETSNANSIVITHAGEATINNVGTATITATRTGDFFYSEAIATVQITVVPRDISNATINITGATVYTGSQLQPAFDVTDTATITTADYDTVWGANINAGTNSGSLTLNGQGNYTGTQIINFAIAKAPNPGDHAGFRMFNAGASASALTQTADLNALRPDVTGEFGTMVYTVTNISDANGIISSPASGVVTSLMNITINPTAQAGQDAVITITAASANFEDLEIRIRVFVNAKEIADVNVTAPANIIYGETLGDPTAQTVTADVIGEFTFHYTGTLSDGNSTAYDSYAKPTLPGNYTVTATLVSDTYAGTGTATFTISPRVLTWNESGIAANKSFDGTTSAEIETMPSINGVLSADTNYVTVFAGTITFASANTGTDITINSSGFGITGDRAWRYTINNTNPAFAAANIIRANGAILANPPTVSTATPPTPTTITVNEITPPTLVGGTVAEIEYTIHTASTLPPSPTWQASVTFTGLTLDTEHFVFARTKETANHNAGVPSVSAAISTLLFHFQGTGTTLDPFIIASEAQLRMAGNGAGTLSDANPYADWTLTAHYRMATDIDLTDKADFPRIGGANETAGFRGTFDGNGHTITGMTVNGTTFQGMFGFVSANAEIRNLNLVNHSVTGTTPVGGVVGQNAGTIENIFLSGTVNGTGTRVGGIAGDNVNTVQNVFTAGTVVSSDTSALANVGGIVGTSRTNSEINNAITTMTINASGGNVGGIAGNHVTWEINDSVALNQSITTTHNSANIGRITGTATGMRNNNHAWYAMSVETAIIWTPDVTLTGKDGADITVAQLQVPDGANFPASFSAADSPWSFHGADFMPQLDSMPNPVPWHSYFSDAAQPNITTQPRSIGVVINNVATLSVAAEAFDGGTLSYQWFSNTTNSNTGGTLISGATNATFTPNTSQIGIAFYYVEITNTNTSASGNQTATRTSAAASVDVREGFPVLVSDGTSTTGFVFLRDALESITVPGHYTVTLNTDQAMTASRTLATGTHVTLIGADSVRTITHEIMSLSMFNLQNANSSLTLGNNITLQGSTFNDLGSVVTVFNGATFTMQPGSRIFGHNTTSGITAAVTIDGETARFVMNGGIIENNLSTAPQNSVSRGNGGVSLLGGTFEMNGGEIRGNRRAATANDTGSGIPADIYVGTEVAADALRLSGNAQIGALTLNATRINDTIYRTSVGISSAFTGTIDTLNLRSNHTQIATVITWWPVNTRIFNGIDSHTVTASDMANIGLGSFISDTNVQRLLSDPASPRVINAEGRLVSAVPPPTGNGSAGNPFQITNEFQLRQVGRGAIGEFPNMTLAAHYILMNDIILTDGIWIPIPSDIGGFIGSFNGNGHAISDMTITATVDNNQGMFRLIGAGGVVENLGLLNININVGNSQVGAIAGRNNGGAIQNVFVTGSVSGSEDVGGIVGHQVSGIIQNVISWASVNANNSNIAFGVGGIVGDASGGTVSNSVALNSSITNTGTVGAQVGRIRGRGAISGSNFARNPMTVNATDFTLNAGATTKDGTNITVAEWGDESWWMNTALFSLSQPIWQNYPPHTLAIGITSASFRLDIAQIADCDCPCDPPCGNNLCPHGLPPEENDLLPEPPEENEPDPELEPDYEPIPHQEAYEYVTDMFALDALITSYENYIPKE